MLLWLLEEVLLLVTSNSVEVIFTSLNASIDELCGAVDQPRVGTSSGNQDV